MIYYAWDYSVPGWCVSFLLYDGVYRYWVKTIFWYDVLNEEDWEGCPLTALIQGF